MSNTISLVREKKKKKPTITQTCATNTHKPTHKDIQTHSHHTHTHTHTHMGDGGEGVSASVCSVIIYSERKQTPDSFFVFQGKVLVPKCERQNGESARWV